MATNSLDKLCEAIDGIVTPPRRRSTSSLFNLRKSIVAQEDRDFANALMSTYSSSLRSSQSFHDPAFLLETLVNTDKTLGKAVSIIVPDLVSEKKFLKVKEMLSKEIKVREDSLSNMSEESEAESSFNGFKRESYYVYGPLARPGFLPPPGRSQADALPPTPDDIRNEREKSQSESEPRRLSNLYARVSDCIKPEEAESVHEESASKRVGFNAA